MQWIEYNAIFTKVISDTGLPYIVAYYQYNKEMQTKVWQVYAHEKITRLLPVDSKLGEVFGSDIPIAEVEEMIVTWESLDPPFIGEYI